MSMKPKRVYVDQKDEQMFRHHWRVLCELWSWVPGLAELTVTDFVLVAKRAQRRAGWSMRKAGLSEAQIKGCLEEAGKRGWAEWFREVGRVGWHAVPRHAAGDWQGFSKYADVRCRTWEE